MKDPAVLFYTSDFLTGTSFFSDAERGQYIRLLCEQHQIGHIPENHMVSVCLSLGSPVVKKFIRDENGCYYNERMEAEIMKRAEFTESRRKNGLNGGRPKGSKKPSGLPSDKPYGKPTNNLAENENENDNTDSNIGVETEKNKSTWRNDYNLYLKECKEAYESFSVNSAWIKEREKYHPGVDISLTLEKSYNDFWATEAGWKNKKQRKTGEIDWKRTFTNAIDQKMNQVRKQFSTLNNGKYNAEKEPFYPKFGDGPIV
jgi:hypothetical protein